MKSIHSFGVAAALSFVIFAPGAASALTTVRVPAVNCYNDPGANLANYRILAGGIANVSGGSVTLICPIVDEVSLPHSALQWFSIEGNDKHNFQSVLADACAYEPATNAAASCGPWAATGGSFIGAFSTNVILWGLSDPVALNWYATLTVVVPQSLGGGFDSIFMGYKYGQF